MGLRVICCLLLYLSLSQGGVIPSTGSDGLYKLVNSFLANPTAAASALGLTRVKRNVDDDAYHFRAAGIEVEFAYHNKDRPIEGGRLGLSFEESVVSKLVPDLKRRFNLGKVKLAVDFENNGNWHNPNFKFEFNYEIQHHGYNEKALFTIMRSLDEKSKKIHTMVDVEHLSVPPAGIQNIIPSFLIHSDELTFITAEFIGHKLHAQLDIENKKVELKSNLGQSLKLNWAASTEDWIRCKAILTLGSNIQYDVDFHAQKRAFPSFGLTVSTGPKTLFAFEAKGVIEPNIIRPDVVKYELRFNSFGIGEGKMRFGWEAEKRGFEGEVLSKEKFQLQYLPRNGNEIKITITTESISRGARITTEVRRNGAPFLNNVIEITDRSEPIYEKIEEEEVTTLNPYNDYGMYYRQQPMIIAYSNSLRFNITTELLNQLAQANFGFTTNQIQGEATDSPFNVKLEVTNDGKRMLLYKIHFGNFPYGVDMEIYDPYYFDHTFNPLKYILFCEHCHTLKLTTDLDTKTPFLTLRKLNYIVGAQYYSYSLTGHVDIDTEEGLHHNFFLQTNHTDNRPNAVPDIEELSVDVKISDSDVKLKAFTNFGPFDVKRVELHSDKLFTDVSLNVYAMSHTVASFAVKGDTKLNSLEPHVKYEILYKIMNVENGKISLSWEGSKRYDGGQALTDMKIQLHYEPTDRPDILMVITPKYLGSKEQEIWSTRTVITHDGKPLLDESLEVSYRPEGVFDLTYKYYDDKKYFQESFRTLEVKGSLKLNDRELLFHKMEVSARIDESTQIIYKFNALESPYEVVINDPYLLPEIYRMAGKPRKDTFLMKGIHASNAGDLKSASKADVYFVYGPNIAEIRTKNDKLIMVGYEDNSAEMGIFNLPGDQSLSGKVSWKFVDSTAEYELNISGLETHNMRLKEDSSKSTFELQAIGDNYWLGKYDISRDGFIRMRGTQLKGGWNGASIIENAPWPSTLHTEVEFDFSEIPWGGRPPVYNPAPAPAPAPAAASVTLPPRLSANSAVAERIAALEELASTQFAPVLPTRRNFLLNISAKALGIKFKFSFNNGRVSLDF